MALGCDGMKTDSLAPRKAGATGSVTVHRPSGIGRGPTCIPANTCEDRSRGFGWGGMAMASLGPEKNMTRATCGSNRSGLGRNTPVRPELTILLGALVYLLCYSLLVKVYRPEPTSKTTHSLPGAGISPPGGLGRSAAFLDAVGSRGRDIKPWRRCWPG